MIERTIGEPAGGGAGGSQSLIAADPALVADYVDRGWWGTETYRDVLRRHARLQPDRIAVVGGERRMTWAAYDERSDRLGATLAALPVTRGDRLAVLVPDGPTVHVVFAAAEKAGLIVMGIGPRAGAREVLHLVRMSGAVGLVALRGYRQDDLAAMVRTMRSELPGFAHHIVVDDDGAVLVDGDAPPPPSAADIAGLAGRGIGPDELFLLNSTSGTTGLPKCIMHTQNRWSYFNQLAVAAGDLSSEDVFMSVVPAPFGFGIWTSHVTPLLLGATTVVLPRFSPSEAMRLIDEERVTVIAAVSTQFIMMLNDASLPSHDLSSLRVMFTGGEAVPRDRAAMFEQRSGSRVLQFYGSNETGALSRTDLTDGDDERLGTAGRVIADMAVRLFDDEGADVTATGGPGQPACRGPATCLGYYDDDDKNAALFTSDGWMLTGDVATVDERGYLRVVGRKSDIIIRGGKNISAPSVEAEVLTHPAVAMAAAVAMPDEIYGERVCIYVAPTPGAELTLAELTAHLDVRGVTKEWWPERLVLLDELPRASGGKVAKGELRADIRRRLAADLLRSGVEKPTL